jgi:hypothetical protein
VGDCEFEQDPHIPVKCAMNCVHSCLGQCAHTYSSQSVTDSRRCYTLCTRKCLPGCVGTEPTSDGTLPVSALLSDAMSSDAF